MKPFDLTPPHPDSDEKPDAILLMRVKAYIEPASPDLRLVARCVRTNKQSGGTDGLLPCFVLMAYRVPAETTIVATLVTPSTGHLGADDIPYRYQQIADRVVIDAIIDGHTQDSTNKRWFYGWVEVEKSAGGYGGWTALTGGRTGDDASSTTRAYNRMEEINGASGLYGNGVDSANLTGTFDIQPIPDGVPVKLELVTVSGAVEFWFSAMNGVDGACEAP